MRRFLSTDGQATVELVALMPVIAAVCLGCWQGVVAAQCWWLAGVAARAASRAEAVGASPLDAARRALPPGRRREVAVEAGDGGRLTVRLPVPPVAGRFRVGRVSATVGPREEGG